MQVIHEMKQYYGKGNQNENGVGPGTLVKGFLQIKNRPPRLASLTANRGLLTTSKNDLR